MERSRFDSDALCDLFLGGMSLYPMAARAGLAYWSELAGTAARCYGDVVLAVMTALRNPQDKDAIAARLATSARTYLEQTGDISERAILDLHHRLRSHLVGLDYSPLPAGSHVSERLISLLRSVADTALSEAWKFESPDAQPDLDVLRRAIERTLEEVRHAQRAHGAAPGTASA